MTILLIFGAIVAAVCLIGVIIAVSMRLTDSKSNEELAQRMPDASTVNHDSSNGMWDGGGGD